MLKTPYSRFKWVAFFEGSSFLALIEFKLNYKVSWKEFFIFIAASLLPFGTFYAEKRWLRPIGAAHGEA